MRSSAPYDPFLSFLFSGNLFPTPPNIRVDDRSIRAETTLQQQQHRSKKLRARNCPRIDIARRSSYPSESVIARGCSFSKQDSGSNALSVMRSRVFWRIETRFWMKNSTGSLFFTCKKSSFSAPRRTSALLITLLPKFQQVVSSSFLLNKRKSFAALRQLTIPGIQKDGKRHASPCIRNRFESFARIRRRSWDWTHFA